MVNPQPLQVRPLEEEERENHLVQVPIEMDGDEGGSEYEYMNGRSAQHEAMNGGGVGVGVGGGAVEVEARASGSGSGSASASASASRTSELTIAFEGEVYVFPAVTPDKVCEYYFSLSFFLWVFGGYILCLVPEKTQWKNKIKY